MKKSLSLSFLRFLLFLCAFFYFLVTFKGIEIEQQKGGRLILYVCNKISLQLHFNKMTLPNLPKNRKSAILNGLFIFVLCEFQFYSRSYWFYAGLLTGC